MKTRLLMFFMVFSLFSFLLLSSFVFAEEDANATREGTDETGDVVVEEASESEGEEIVISPAGETEESNVAEEETQTNEAIEELPEPGILPGNLFYGFKTGFQNLRLALLRNEAKERYRLNLLDIRITELNKLKELREESGAAGKSTEKIDARIETLTERYENTLERSEERVEKLKALGRNVTALREHVAERTRKHALVLKRVSEKAPVKTRVKILRAMNRSLTGYENAVSAILQEKGLTEDEAKDLMTEAKERYRENIKARKEEGKLCAQVITQAYNLETQECKFFGSPCDVPEGWKRGACKVKELRQDAQAIRQDVRAFRQNVRAVRQEARKVMATNIAERRATITAASAE